MDHISEQSLAFAAEKSIKTAMIWLEKFSLKVIRYAPGWPDYIQKPHFHGGKYNMGQKEVQTKGDCCEEKGKEIAANLLFSCNFVQMQPVLASGFNLFFDSKQSTEQWKWQVAVMLLQLKAGPEGMNEWTSERVSEWE